MGRLEIAENCEKTLHITRNFHVFHNARGESHVIRGVSVGSGATGRRGKEEENEKRVERTRNRRSFDVAVVLPENNQYYNVQGSMMLMPLQGSSISGVSGLRLHVISTILLVAFRRNQTVEDRRLEYYGPNKQLTAKNYF